MLTIGPRYARSQTFVARQFHPQPVGSHLHIYLTKVGDAVRAETGGQLDVTVHAQNNGAIIADPDGSGSAPAGRVASSACGPSGVP
jgi:TRAP-type C4-dicarboxylate transport system substrate-binding protein